MKTIIAVLEKLKLAWVGTQGVERSALWDECMRSTLGSSSAAQKRPRSRWRFWEAIICMHWLKERMGLRVFVPNSSLRCSMM